MKRYLVESAAIRQNLETLKKRAGKARLFAVVKGNGYGLGLVPLAAICRDAGVDTFCVTEVSDATQLRGAGFTQQILMIRPTCDVDEVHQLLDLDVVLTVSSQDDAAVLNGIATQRKQKVKAHIEIDTGMGRYGFLPGEMDKLLHIYSYMDGLDLCGIYTHFHSAFCNKKATDLQMVCFRSVIRQLQEKGFDVGICHCCNSAGLLRFPITRWTPCASARQSSADSLLRAATISSASARWKRPSTSCAGFPRGTPAATAQAGARKSPPASRFFPSAGTTASAARWETI